MNRTNNPFAPGAGTQPPELAGREAIIADAKVALGRTKLGRSARSQMLLGLRGVGKTVLLNRIAEEAQTEGYGCIVLEAPEDRPLAEMLVPPLRRELFKMSRNERAKDVARRGLAVLRAFASAFKISAGDVEFSASPEVGTADTGNLDADLPELLLAVAQAAKEGQTPLALFIDEVQYLSDTDLRALISSVHKLGQKSLPFLLFGAGLPQLAGLAGEAKSYAERLFQFPGVGPLAVSDAKEAIRAPIEREGAKITDEALDVIVEMTQGHPYFLQEWGSHAWNVAASSLITVVDAGAASRSALEALDDGFFRVRLDRLTPRERDYMRAMATLGPGPHRSGEIAQKLNMDVTAVGPLRSGLIKKGMIFSPQHGDTAFTVPMFDEFLCRSMPNWGPPPQPPIRKRKPKPSEANTITTVADGTQAAAAGAVVAFVRDANKIRFEVDLGAMGRAGLKIRAPMLVSARSVRPGAGGK